MKRLINIIKSKLGICIHDYERYDERMIEFGMGKLLYLRCKKCPKKTVKVI